MTLKFSESPAVQIKEIDLTGNVPSVTSTTGAIVGDFNWGPDTPVLIGNESELAAVFGNPTSGGVGSESFLSAAHFLKYSSSLYVVNTSEGGKASDAQFIAKYKGALGNSIQVCVGDSTDDSSVVNYFDASPDGDEINIAVKVNGEVVETFDFVSSQSGATTNGTNNYVVDVINSRSSWVTLSDVPSAGTFDLSGGSNSSSTKDQVLSCFDKLANKDDFQIDFLISPEIHMATVDVADKMIEIAEQRKDCVAVISIPENLSLPLGTEYDLTNSNYAFIVQAGLKVYDKYNDKYVTISASASTAGIMAASDSVSAPWFSPAGSRRGQYLGVTELLDNPSKTKRDTMYKNGVNPIVSMPGQGIVLFGDKTYLSRPSAFDRINVRRLFLVIERAISEAGQNVMFEFNDEFTRAEFVNIVEPFLREIQGRRGISDFRVVCDETNNTPEVIDRNEFIASCFIKPARSINYVTLNFVAVRTGVDFEEVVGTV
tara:strand:- start:946 stop:2403 length:1458 start_codon:yes stop_codon:yes gene_type:complete